MNIDDVAGARELLDKLGDIAESAGARAAMASASAKVMASMATEAFTRESARPAPWPPLGESTLSRAGASAKDAVKARDKAKEWTAKAADAEAKAAGKKGKALGKALASAAKSRAKAKEWKAKARAAKAAAIADRKPLIDTGLLSKGIMPVSGADVFGVRSDRPYAVFHQYGTRNMPARPFVPALGAPGSERLTPDAERSVRDAMDAAVAKLARDAGLKAKPG